MELPEAIPQPSPWYSGSQNLQSPFVAEAHAFTVSGADRATDGPTIVKVTLMRTCDAILELQLQKFGRVCHKYRKYGLDFSYFNA